MWSSRPPIRWWGSRWQQRGVWPARERACRRTSNSPKRTSPDCCRRYALYITPPPIQHVCMKPPPIQHVCMKPPSIQHICNPLLCTLRFPCWAPPRPADWRRRRPSWPASTGPTRRCWSRYCVYSYVLCVLCVFICIVCIQCIMCIKCIHTPLCMYAINPLYMYYTPSIYV
jgi:hypothetical protein